VAATMLRAPQSGRQQAQDGRSAFAADHRQVSRSTRMVRIHDPNWSTKATSLMPDEATEGESHG